VAFGDLLLDRELQRRHRLAQTDPAVAIHRRGHPREVNDRVLRDQGAERLPVPFVERGESIAHGRLHAGFGHYLFSFAMEALASASRPSAAPAASPVCGSTQIECADPWWPCTRTVWPMPSSARTVSALTPSASIVTRSGSHS